MEPKSDRRRLAAILASDMVGYSRLMDLDESGPLARLKAHRVELIDPSIAKNGGRIVKTTGDGILVEFASVIGSVGCALEIQRRMARRNADMPLDKRIEFRIGINLGDIIVDGDDVYGSGVNIAARLEGLAEPGGICLSDLAHGALERKIDETFEDVGEQELKNIGQPVRVWRWRQAEDGTAQQTPQSPPKASDRPSLAVLAFDNMSGDAEQEYFSDGISEDIITDLSKLAGLHVIARNSSFVYKNSAVSIPEVARDLGVRYILEGSVRRAGNRVRVTAQLIDSTSGGHVWADRFDRDLTDIFDVQDELTQQIVTALKLRLTPDEKDRLADRGTENVEAYNLLLRAREQLWLHTRAGNIKARELLETALAIDARFAAALAYVAFTLINDYVNGWTDEADETLRLGLEMAKQSVAMNAEDHRTHFALSAAYLWSREHDRALTEAEHCMTLAPGSTEGYLTTAHTEIFRGNPDAALLALDTYMRLDPLYPDIALHFLAEAYISKDQYQDAVDALEERRKRNPEAPSVHALLASCYGHLGRLEEGKAAVAELLRVFPDFAVEQRRRVLPFKDPQEFDRRIEGMRKSGLPQ